MLVDMNATRVNGEIFWAKARSPILMVLSSIININELLLRLACVLPFASYERKFILTAAQ